MTDSIRQRIDNELDRIEQAESVVVLYACESGSRAWGFESADSDYDVRFIYLRPTPWYLTIRDNRSVIERPIHDELDIAGWDVSKTLGLFRKSNPPLYEWLKSPIVYQRRSAFIDRLRGLVDDYYSPIACMYHYLHMAQNNHRKYLVGDEVWVKKYFYVLRPVLACLWIERGLGAVPMLFSDLVDATVDDPALKAEIDSLLAAKRAGAELDSGPRNPVIADFLDAQLARLEASTQPPARSRDPEVLDALFLDTLIEVNGPELASA